MSDPLGHGSSTSPTHAGPPWAAYAMAAAFVGGVTAVGLLLRDHLQVTDAAMLYLLAVVIVAVRSPRGPALLAAALSVLAFDVTFVPPYGRLVVHDTAFLLTFAIMFLVAVVMSGLTARIREETLASEARERRTATLYELSRDLATASDANQVSKVVADHLGTAVAGRASVALARQGEGDAGLDYPGGPTFASPRTREAAQWVHTWDLAAGRGTGEFPDLPLLLLPIRAALTRHGVVAIEGPGLGSLGMADRRTLELVVRHAALALERQTLAAKHEAAEVAVEAERLRSTLLSSISHDLRTPLGGIEGAASTLLEGEAALPPAARRELLETIQEESRRMTRMVTNLLDMVRVESGLLVTKRAWIPIEEVIGVARLRLDAPLADRLVDVHLPADQLLVSIDEVLIEQVLVNLLENAVRYTPDGTPITVRAERCDTEVHVEVADRGPGVPAGEEEAVFRKFYRVSADETRPGRRAGGTGLGLAICRGVVTAHGGRIWCERRPGGGASFRFTLPTGTPPIGPGQED